MYRLPRIEIVLACPSIIGFNRRVLGSSGVCPKPILIRARAPIRTAVCPLAPVAIDSGPFLHRSAWDLELLL
jgi:hypothetical protein